MFPRTVGTLVAITMLVGCAPAISDYAYVVTDGELEVTGVDMRFDPAEIVVPADEPVRITLHNPDTVDHDIDIEQGDVFLHLHAHPGEPSSWTVEFPRGRYEFVCSVPGHEEAGMTGVIISR